MPVLNVKSNRRMKRSRLNILCTRDVGLEYEAMIPRPHNCSTTRQLDVEEDEMRPGFGSPGFHHLCATFVYFLCPLHHHTSSFPPVDGIAAIPPRLRPSYLWDSPQLVLLVVGFSSVENDTIDPCQQQRASVCETRLEKSHTNYL